MLVAPADQPGQGPRCALRQRKERWWSPMGGGPARGHCSALSAGLSVGPGAWGVRAGGAPLSWVSSGAQSPGPTAVPTGRCEGDGGEEGLVPPRVTLSDHREHCCLGGILQVAKSFCSDDSICLYCNSTSFFTENQSHTTGTLRTSIPTEAWV